MTDTEAALLKAIGERPDDDTPRLVYADFLQEQGGASNDARAELIRAHVRAARLPDGDPERLALEGRVMALLYTWDVIWQRDMPPGFTRLAYYRRGFPFRALATASQMGAADDPRLQLVEYLEFTPDVPARRLAAVLGHPVFARAKTLVARGLLLLGPGGAVALAGASFPRLERLVLANQGIGDAGLRALGPAPGFPTLRELDVSHNGIYPSALEAFRRSPLGAALDHIDCHGNPYV